MATTIVVKHYGKVVKREMKFYRPELLLSNLTELEGKEFEVTIKEKTKKVSTDAHAFYRGGIIKECMRYEMFGGWTKDEIHEFFADMFLGYFEMVKHFGADDETTLKEVRKIRSTSALNSKEMSEYCEYVIRWLAQHSIVIKDPEQYEQSKF